MASTEDPNDLLVKVSLANRKAFEQLYQLTSAKLFAISLRITKQEKLSEDALQESFIKIWDKAKHFDPKKAQAITWMGTIVRNQSIDLIRKNQKHDYHEMFDEEITSVENTTSSPEQLAITHYKIDAINVCLSELEATHRTLITMAYLDGYTHKQISEIKGIPIGSVKTWIHRGIEKTKHCLALNEQNTK